MLEWMNETPDGLDVRIRAVPRASKNEIQGVYDKALKIRLTTAPVDGKANQALIKFLSKELKLAQSQVTLIRGETVRRKTVHLSGLTQSEFIERLAL